MRTKRNRLWVLVMALMMVFTQAAVTAHAADATDSQSGIYFSDRDIESYYGGKNNMYFTPLYILNDGRREVAYCYNGTKAWAMAAPGKPDYPISGQYDEDYYIENKLYFTKVENPTAKDWAENSENNADVNDVKKVLYTGYPYDAAGIQKKYNLEDTAYRAVTQGAIWKVSSGISLKAALADFTYSGFKWTQDMTDAYDELLATAPTVALPAGFMMNLFLSENTGYQNLLSTGLTLDEITHLGTGSLNISKKVTGEAGEMQKEFTFRVEFLDASGNELTEAFNYSGSKEGTVKSGETITLKSDETVKIEGIPVDATYKVTEEEADADGYTTTATGDEGTITHADSDASFENHRDEVPADEDPADVDEGDNEEADPAVDAEDKDDSDSAKKGKGPDTSDNSNLPLLMALMALSAGGIASMSYTRRGKKEHK